MVNVWVSSEHGSQRTSRGRSQQASRFQGVVCGIRTTKPPGLGDDDQKARPRSSGLGLQRVVCGDKKSSVRSMRHTQSYWVEWSLGINVQPKQMEEWMAGRRGSIREWGEGLSREQPIKAIV